ncbi:hypothetical protein ARMA_2704 [Ardenticatena maritima]|uniref:PsbP C-terminal domain-containing protein n=1 Tax=Ardenticatena maritima TaxID=872965 RepID=A0A0M8KAL5_9CHLR|nr:hypothetical protein [Ardenticatena maritima]KPL89673.1 hypothetical protein SE16_04555 [Ardenticatena maritima]GAP64281.1 hypothetical protein ARMA_2704 [Ardenticatena maritima]
MNRTVKIALIIVGITLAICCLAFFGGYLFLKRQFDVVADPDQARTMAHSITDYTLPSGYSEQFGFRVANLFTYVVIAPTTNEQDGMLFVLAQAPDDAGFDPETARTTVEGQVGRRMEGVQQTEERTVTIRGEERTMLIFEGTDAESGEAMRMAFVSFTGNNGPAFLLVISPSTAWDEEALNQFIASMR